jgi:phosphatidylinositol-3,4,5-trisphosphate 3-phosphatase/dual-specificity protein phosphatase PTEN
MSSQGIDFHMEEPPIRVAATTAAVAPSSPAAASKTRQGWLWKFSVGRSMFGRRNWRNRYFVATPNGVAYYASQPASKADLSSVPCDSVLWSQVTHVYDVINSAIEAEANDPEENYFGIRFFDGGEERLLLLRTAGYEERTAWAAHLGAMFRGYKLRLRAHQQRGGEALEEPRAARSSSIFEAVHVKLRGMVSLKKQRYQQDGVDLDLAYITPQLIAMGFPSEGAETMYRNPMPEVVDFFDAKHPGQVKVYNLCSERWYPPSRFGGVFERFPFDDHNPPPLALIWPCCASMHAHLAASPAHVAAVHCKAGKGRTGLIIAAYLIYSGQCVTAQDALDVFAEMRTKDGKGVAIPSQKRYLTYFAEIMRRYRAASGVDTAVAPLAGVLPAAVPDQAVCLVSIELSHCPAFRPSDGCDPYLIIKRRRVGHRHVPLGVAEVNVEEGKRLDVIYDSRHHTPLQHFSADARRPVMVLEGCSVVGEVQLFLWDGATDGVEKDCYMCSWWLHTGMLAAAPKPGGQVVLALPQHTIDDAVKDKKNRQFPAGFGVVIRYRVV